MTWIPQLTSTPCYDMNLGLQYVHLTHVLLYDTIIKHNKNVTNKIHD